MLNYGLSVKRDNPLPACYQPCLHGIKRTYPKEEQVNIQIQLDTLDNQLKKHDRVDMIKIDVEALN